MTPTTNASLYEKVADLAEAGQLEQALTLTQGHLQKYPDDGQALNDAGAILYAMGRYDEAVAHLHASLEHFEIPQAETLWNLAEAYIAGNQPEKALDLFNQMVAAEILSPDLAVRTASKLLDLGQTAQAVEALLTSLKVHPEQDVLTSALQAIRGSRPKLAMFCGPRTQDELGSFRSQIDDRFEARWIEQVRPEEVALVLEEADLAWFDSCSSVVAIASKADTSCHVVWRMRSISESDPWLDEIRWEGIDQLLLPCPFAEAALRRRVEGLQDRTCVSLIPHGVDTDGVPLAESRRDTRNIACVGYENLSRSPELLEMLQGPIQQDPTLSLHVMAENPFDVPDHDLRGQMTRAELRGSVTFNSRPENPNTWLIDKSYLLATASYAEQSTLTLECIAAGLKPLIYNPEGIRTPLTDRFGFRDEQELCSMVLQQPLTPEEYRQFIREHYDHSEQNERFNEVIVAFEKQWARDQS